MDPLLEGLCSLKKQPDGHKVVPLSRYGWKTWHCTNTLCVNSEMASGILDAQSSFLPNVLWLDKYCFSVECEW